MTQIVETRSFPLRTILCTMHANKLGGRGVERTLTTIQDSAQLQRYMYPGVIRPSHQEEGHYLRNQFSALLRKQFPQFANVSIAKVTQSNFDEWLEVQETEFGEHIEVPVIGKNPQI